MLYKKYQMYDDKVEIMVPSHLKLTNTYLTSQYNWMSDDRKVVINVARGGSDLDEENLLLRLDEYYKGFNKDISEFECTRVYKRKINTHSYGEICYLSDMSGYKFYTVFLLGCFEGREMIITLQCMEQQIKQNEHIFENIADSLRIKKKQNMIEEEEKYDS